MTLLRLTDIRRRTLDGLALEIGVGQHTAVSGRSGAGKTTLVRLVLGLDRPDEGTVEVAGRVVGAPRTLRWLRPLVQLVAQDASGSLDPRHDVRSIVSEPLLCLGIRTPDRVEEVVDLVRLPTSVLDRRPGELSGGQRQRVALARALAPAPRLLVADEPFSGLDSATRLALAETLSEVLDGSGTTLLLVSHDPGTTRLLCPRRLELVDGRLR
jgi:peptide/nickel transport system ATP-binding protein